MKFSKQLFLIFCVATAIPLIASWFVLGNITYKKEVADVQTRHLLIARNLASSLQRYHNDLEAGFSLISSNLIAGHQLSDTNKFTTALGFRHFCIADFKTGKVINQVGPETAPCPKLIPSSRLTDLKNLIKNDKITFSPVWPGPKNKPLIYIVKKTGDKLAVASINTEYFIRLGKAVAFGKIGHAAIVDQQGNILAHPKPDWVAQRKNIAQISIVQRMLAGKTGVAQFYSPAARQEMIAGFSSVKGTGWSVMVPQPVSELKEKAGVAHKTFFSIVALCIFLAGLVAATVARVIMRSVNSVIDVAKEVEQGNNDVALDVDDSWHVPHEFKDLQKRFNAMAKSVAKYQKKQRQERDRAEFDSSTKAEYFANLAHELKTPLNSILGFSSVLRESKPGTLKPHETSEFLGHIEKSAGHLLTFVNDLLDLNRLDMGAHKLNEHPLFITDPIRFCEATLRRQIENKQIDLVIDCDDKNLKIIADERSMNQMLINLVSNAVRYSFDKGKITISVEQGFNGDVKIDINDNGIGIPEEDLKDILLPFKRANDPQVAEIHGTGLGLSIVNKLAKLHGIGFSIKSEHGFSTTATLTIPSARVIRNEPETTEVA
jgi:signal transduction histidine kinase